MAKFKSPWMEYIGNNRLTYQGYVVRDFDVPDTDRCASVADIVAPSGEVIGRFYFTIISYPSKPYSTRLQSPIACKAFCRDPHDNRFYDKLDADPENLLARFVDAYESLLRDLTAPIQATAPTVEVDHIGRPNDFEPV